MMILLLALKKHFLGPQQIGWRCGGMSRSYSTQRDKDYSDRKADSQANQGAMTHLSEQISTLNDRMDDFTSCVEELNSNLTTEKRRLAHKIPPYEERPLSNGSISTSYFMSGLENGSLTGCRMPNSTSSSQLAKEPPLMEEVPSFI
ncbi:nucleotide kinase [Lithospermum erythrorhizon]|uniref:Nucleotide kinase n=1 Tax=Lithospermum erythrorhizon TaxID=34254 RepID=A0AAV3PGJ5_LITER